MRAINEGDWVVVIMNRNNIYSFQTSCRFVAKVMSTPSDIGDLWYLKYGENDSTTDITVNPLSSEFIGFEKPSGSALSKIK